MKNNQVPLRASVPIPRGRNDAGRACSDLLEAAEDAAAALPFAAEAFHEVSVHYQRMVETGDPHAHRCIELWTYAFVARYFALRARSACSRDPSLCDLLVEKALVRIQSGRIRLRSPAAYVAWVHQVCRNLLVDAARRPLIRSFDPPEALMLRSPTTEMSWRLEHADCKGAAYRAVQQLPPYLRQVVEQRFGAGLDYETIAERTGLSVATLRAYVSRALKALRRSVTD